MTLAGPAGEASQSDLFRIRRRARHTFATELRRDAGDLGVVQRMLGHSDVHTTEAFYGHYDLSDLEAAMERFARSRHDPD